MVFHNQSFRKPKRSTQGFRKPKRSAQGFWKPKLSTQDSRIPKRSAYDFKNESGPHRVSQFQSGSCQQIRLRLWRMENLAARFLVVVVAAFCVASHEQKVWNDCLSPAQFSSPWRNRVSLWFVFETKNMRSPVLYYGRESFSCDSQMKLTKIMLVRSLDVFSSFFFSFLLEWCRSMAASKMS